MTGVAVIGGGGLADLSSIPTTGLDFSSFGIGGTNNATGGGAAAPVASTSMPLASPQAAATVSPTFGVGGNPGDSVPGTRVTLGSNGQLISGGGGATRATPQPGAQANAGVQSIARNNAPKYNPWTDPARVLNPIADWSGMYLDERITLEWVAKQFGSSVAELRALNPNAKPGAYIVIPIHDVTTTGGGPGLGRENAMPQYIADALAKNGIDPAAAAGGAPNGQLAGGAAQQQQVQEPATGGGGLNIGTGASGGAAAGATGLPTAASLQSMSLEQLQSLYNTLAPQVRRDNV